MEVVNVKVRTLVTIGKTTFALPFQFDDYGLLRDIFDDDHRQLLSEPEAEAFILAALNRTTNQLTDFEAKCRQIYEWWQTTQKQERVFTDEFTRGMAYAYITVLDLLAQGRPLTAELGAKKIRRG